jgi:hypothetical protein
MKAIKSIVAITMLKLKAIISPPLKSGSVTKLLHYQYNYGMTDNMHTHIRWPMHVFLLIKFHAEFTG